MAFDDPPEELRLAAEREAQRRDREDFDRELAGIEGRHIARFFMGAASRIAAFREKREAERLWRTLAELLLDPIYRAHYERFGNFLDETRRWAEEMEAEINAALEAVNGRIDEMLDAAPRLPDGGPRVFRFADGRVIDEYGNRVAPEIAEGIAWPENAPSAEDYLAALERRDALEQGRDDLETFRVETLGPAQNRYEDEERGITIDEMDAIEADIRVQQERITRVVSDLESVTQTASAENDSVAEVKPLTL